MLMRNVCFSRNDAPLMTTLSSAARRSSDSPAHTDHPLDAARRASNSSVSENRSCPRQNGNAPNRRTNGAATPAGGAFPKSANAGNATP